jgi:hypothetical protein
MIGAKKNALVRVYQRHRLILLFQMGALILCVFRPSAKGAETDGRHRLGGAAVAPPITLSERSSTGLALLRIFVGYLCFQQLFWKLPPTFAGLYGYVVRESQHAILPG